MKQRVRNGQIWLVLLDAFAFVASYIGVIYWRASPFGHWFVDHVARLMGDQPGVIPAEMIIQYLERAPVILLALLPFLLVCYGLCDVYQTGHRLWPRPLLWDLIRANTLVFLTIMLALYFRRNIWHPRSFFLLVFFVNILTARFSRLACHAAAGWARRRFGLGVWRVLLIGDSAEADRIARRITANPDLGLQLVEHSRSDFPPVTGGSSVEEVVGRMARQGMDLLIVAGDKLSRDVVMRLLQSTHEADLGLKTLTHSLGVLQSEAGLAFDHVSGIPLVHFDPPSLHTSFGMGRRIASSLAAFFLLVLFSPLLIFLAVMIKLEDGGRVFFVQERVGANRKTFKIYKFRTMVEEAEYLQEKLEKMNESRGGGLFKIRRDPRITRVGALLRKWSLDELPQLVNVVKGDMLLVGPRPLPRRDYDRYCEQWHYDRHSGMPGMTCLWQISGRSEVSFDDMCVLDLYYLRNRSWVLDLKILFKTAWVVMFARGAY